VSAGRTWIGVDLGTQSVRALAADDAGTVLASASRPLRSTRWQEPDGTARHEQDPHTWCDRSSEALAEVVATVGAGTVAGLAVDATSGTVALVDDDGAALTPGVMYDDDRGSAHAAAARDAGAATWGRLGLRIGTTWALPTLLALLAGQPAGRTTPRAHVAHQTDVVARWLVGRPVATDSSSALKTGYDAENHRWPVEVFAELGVEPDTLPVVVAPGAALGVVGPDAAAATGLRAGTPVRAGMTDGCAAQLGAGAVTPGAWNAVLGTTLVLKGVTTSLVHDPAGTVYSHRAPQGGWWLPGGASSTGAGVLADLIDPERFDAITARLAADPPGTVPVAYPLAGRGERFPFAAEDAEGFWLDGGRTRPLSELVGAVGEDAAFAALCEGVACVERMAVEHLAALGAEVSGDYTVSGGATRNRWWTGRRADLLGVAAQVPETAEPAFGMALLARAGVDADAAGDGGGPDVAAAASAMVRIAEVVEPHADPALQERYEAFRTALAGRGWT